MNATTLKSEDIVRILNMMYSVFLAILARFAIHQTGGFNSEALEIKFLLSENNWVLVLLLSIYFIFDWLTTNITVPLKAKVSLHLLLPFMIIGIVVLGGLVAFAFVPSSSWMFFFGLYAFIVPWYDIITIKGDDEKTSSLSRLFVIHAIILLRVTTGLFVLIIASVKLWLYPGSHLEISDGLFIKLIILYVIFKALRYALMLPCRRKDATA